MAYFDSDMDYYEYFYGPEMTVDEPQDDKSVIHLGQDLLPFTPACGARLAGRDLVTSSLARATCPECLS